MALVQFAFGQILMPPPIANEDVSMLQTQYSHIRHFHSCHEKVTSQQKSGGAALAQFASGQIL